MLQSSGILGRRLCNPVRSDNFQFQCRQVEAMVDSVAEDEACSSSRLAVFKTRTGRKTSPPVRYGDHVCLTTRKGHKIRTAYILVRSVVQAVADLHLSHFRSLEPEHFGSTCMWDFAASMKQDLQTFALQHEAHAYVLT